MKRTLR